MSALPQHAQQLCKKFPRWNIWQSDAGRWWATNKTITLAQINAECTATVDADTLGELETILVSEEDLLKDVAS